MNVSPAPVLTVTYPPLLVYPNAVAAAAGGVSVNSPTASPPSKAARPPVPARNSRRPSARDPRLIMGFLHEGWPSRPPQLPLNPTQQARRHKGQGPAPLAAIASERLPCLRAQKEFRGRITRLRKFHAGPATGK